MNNNNSTVVEKFNYLDMLDPKNSWYFDAERFDVNFPLVCSYRGYRVSEDIYNYFNVVSEYYKSQENIHVLIAESKYPHELYNYYVADREAIEYSVPPTDSEFEIIEKGRHFRSMWAELTMGRYFFPERKFMFSLTERIGNIFYTRFLFCTKFDGSAEELKSKYFTSPTTQFVPDRGFPYLQTITTQDWDLIKRYLFFMIRNHQYKYADLTYFLPNLEISVDDPVFVTDVDTTEELFRTLPEDARGEDNFVKKRLIFYEPITEFEPIYAV